MSADFAIKVYHWPFLAQPAPLPERLIGGDPAFYVEWTLKSWTAAHDLSAFDPQALADYRVCFGDPDRTHAACNDYRAGATIDRAIDEADLAAGRRIACPVLVLWGAGGLPAEQGKGEDPERHPLAIWRRYASDVRGAPVPCGHFMPEEARGDGSRPHRFLRRRCMSAPIDRQATFSGTGEVRAQHRFDEAALERWLAANLPASGDR